MDEVLAGLNEAQRAAVTSAASVLQVLAPPGSGKTKTLTARIGYLIAHRQLQPWNIIVCTFTVKAAKEMKDRVTTIVGNDLAKKIKLGTFHSVSLRYLKTYGHYIGVPRDFSVADSSDSKAILKRILKKLDIRMDPGQALGRVSNRKVKGSSPNHEKQSTSYSQNHERQFDTVFAEYEATLAASKLLDYDDLLLRCCDLLRSHPDCVSNVEFVLVDEFQDTNTVQYDLMALFAQRQNNITIVGDPDQSIYGFRMAEIANLSKMKRQWPDTLTLNLEENYRSSGAILDAAQKIIEQDASRPDKKLRATHGFGEQPVLRKLPNAEAEADWLVSEIQRIHHLSGKMINFSDFAILLRSAFLSRVIESSLGRAGIPYRMVGGSKFYDRFEVKLLLDYLRAINQPGNNEVLERVLNVPPRRIGDATVTKLQEEAQRKKTTIWSLILDATQGRGSLDTKITAPAKKGLTALVDIILSGQKKLQPHGKTASSLLELVNFVAQKISFQDFLRSKYPDATDYENRWENVEELMAMVEDADNSGTVEQLGYDDELTAIDGMEQSDSSSTDGLSAFLDNISLTASAETPTDEEGGKVQQVTISTIHAAKGLEWPVVFLPACFEGMIPHSRAENHDEERRLLYVGITRAQALLYLSYPMENTQRDDTDLSNFLTQAGVQKFFGKKGPSLSSTAIKSLAKVVGREVPPQTQIDEARKVLGSLEDDNYTVDGKRSHTAPARSIDSGTKPPTYALESKMPPWSNAPTHLPPGRAGFGSVAAQYDALMEQAKSSDRKGGTKKGNGQSKSNKRKADGQENTEPFFGKRQKPASPSEEKGFYRPEDTLAGALREVYNSAVNAGSNPLFPVNAANTMPLPTHRPQMKPSSTKPASKDARDGSNTKPYGFLSSPPKADEQPVSLPQVQNSFQPASTFHKTTMSSVGPQRRTLGVKRSLQGWNAGNSVGNGGVNVANQNQGNHWRPWE